MGRGRARRVAGSALRAPGVPLGGTDGPWPRPESGRLAPSGHRRSRWGNGSALSGAPKEVRGEDPRHPSLHEERGMGDGDIGVGMGTAAPSAMAGRHAGGSSRRHEPRTGQLDPDARAAEDEPRVDRPAPTPDTTRPTSTDAGMHTCLMIRLTTSWVGTTLALGLACGPALSRVCELTRSPLR